MASELDIKAHAWRIVNEELPRWVIEYGRSSPNSKLSPHARMELAAHHCVIAALEAAEREREQERKTLIAERWQVERATYTTAEPVTGKG